MQHVLVTGGAGYVGSHACKRLKASGFIPVTFDDLSTGWADAVKFGPLVKGDLADRVAVDQAFEEYAPIAVMHFAAFSQVGEAERDPGKYWRNNVVGSLNLIESAVTNGCLNFVFSSTCSVYGDQDGVLLDEDCPQAPLNAYSASKRAIEDMLRDFGNSHGLRSVIFRYFNVAGSDQEGEIGEYHKPETHLIPLAIAAISGDRDGLVVYGDDYDTPDGTCVRDYVHVMDLVDAHVRGLQWLQDGKGSRVFNLGTGIGFSVREVLEHCQVVTNRSVPWTMGERRAGDCTKLVSGSTRALEELGWSPARSNLGTMIADAWRWHQSEKFEK